MERRRAESILNHADDSSDPVAEVVQRASAPGTAGELAGHDEALALFRLARARRGAPTPGPAPGDSSAARPDA